MGLVGDRSSIVLSSVLRVERAACIVSVVLVVLGSGGLLGLGAVEVGGVHTLPPALLPPILLLLLR